jgi:hypothetical protein
MIAGAAASAIWRRYCQQKTAIFWLVRKHAGYMRMGIRPGLPAGCAAWAPVQIWLTEMLLSDSQDFQHLRKMQRISISNQCDSAWCALQYQVRQVAAQCQVQLVHKAYRLLRGSE